MQIYETMSVWQVEKFRVTEKYNVRETWRWRRLDRQTWPDDEGSHRPGVVSPANYLTPSPPLLLQSVCCLATTRQHVIDRRESPTPDPGLSQSQ